jgi:hypothetical protein
MTFTSHTFLTPGGQIIKRLKFVIIGSCMTHTPRVLSSRVRYIASRSHTVRLNLLPVTDAVSLHCGFNIEDFHFGDLYEYKEEANPRVRAVQGVGSAAARLLRIEDSNPPGGGGGAWLSVSCDCCVLSGRGVRVGLITCPEDSY